MFGGGGGWVGPSGKLTVFGQNVRGAENTRKLNLNGVTRTGIVV